MDEHPHHVRPPLGGHRVHLADAAGTYCGYPAEFMIQQHWVIVNLDASCLRCKQAARKRKLRKQ
jgi:hypothetical protein